MIFFGNSICGKRPTNEDNWTAIKLAENTYFAAVADGMGGANGGEIASALVIRRLVDVLNSQEYESDFDLKELLLFCFESAQHVLSQKIQEEPDLKGLATTLSCILIHNNKCVWGNIGDSRIYSYNSAQFSLLTEDHTYLNELIQKKDSLDTEDAEEKYGHILTRVIDGNNDKPDIFPLGNDYLKLHGNDFFLLCSDGAVINKAQTNFGWLNQILLSSGRIDEFVNEVISYALNNDSSDNITVVALDYAGILNKRKVKKGNIINRTRSQSNRIKIKAAVIAILLLAVSFGIISNYNFATKTFGFLNKLSVFQPSDLNENNDLKNDSISVSNPEKLYEESINDQFDLLVKEGNELLNNGRLLDAISKYEEAIKIKSDQDELITFINQLKSRLK